MKKQIVSISILQSAKIMTVMYVLMGFIYTLIGLGMMFSDNPMIKKIGFFYCFGPIFSGIGGFLFFVIFAALYNVLAKWCGGFEVEVKNIE